MSALPPLAERLRARIEASGPITFADFMEAALYDSDGGFYERPAVGERGDFVTSPHVSPAFAALLARQVEEFWQLLDRPSRFDIVELGGGDGTLAQQLIAALPPEMEARYTIVERSAAARAAATARDVRAVADVGDVGLVEGCVIANELLDNLPFHRVRRVGGRLVERHVATRAERFELIDAPPSPDVERHAPRDLGDGEEGVVPVAAFDLIARLPSILRRGYALFVDYGWARDDERRDAVHSYREHRNLDDVLDQPGTRDITAGLDFAALATHARACGMHVWGPVTQRDALMALGFRDLAEDARLRQVEATEARRGVDAMRIYSDRNRADLLVAPGGLGDFHVICFGIDVDPHRTPTAMRPMNG